MDALVSLSEVLSAVDSDLIDALLAWHSDGTWQDLVQSRQAWRLVIAPESLDRGPKVDPTEIEKVAEAFARLIDEKVSAHEHSSRAAACAQGIAQELGMDAGAQGRLYRAGLLHDIGKLGVPDRILEKPGPLTPRERQRMEHHPIYTWEILSWVPVFHDIAWTAALHHERLDGSGYPWKLDRIRLGREARILAVADAYEAMTSSRPYRPALPREAALSLLREDAGTRLDAEAILGLTRYLHRDATSGPCAAAVLPA